ncbi:MAG TPA: hypothetical protein DCG19_14475 [Cryomorphaceae bacterium]|nr:hypothetical protein [Owenweeksia sp.]HAD98613.1 hypothetical protein [Cryomorphaceae bacterium]HBF20154.1 hypothetical protein [Cryomorphaceae bacterium]|tara:strand:- start:3 stop:680 length:678 start_codon:yes stop_codon:yes gene_type:complete
MKTLSKFFAFALISWTVASCGNAPEETVETKEAEEVAAPQETAATYAMVTDGDEIMWEGYKTISGDSHTGTMQVTEGSFTVENGEVTGGSFTIDMNSIYNEDLPEEGDYNKAKLVGHLKSEDFFYVEKYPTATFTITSVSPVEGKEGATHMVSGNLNMRGNEKNITFPAKIDVSGDKVSLTTPEFVIDRTNWEVMYLSANLASVAKDKAVDNNIKLQLNVEAQKA